LIETRASADLQQLMGQRSPHLQSALEKVATHWEEAIRPFYVPPVDGGELPAVELAAGTTHQLKESVHTLVSCYVTMLEFF
jgi:hypothetical protein